VNYENDQLLVSHNILNMWKISYSQLLNVHSVSSVRQIETHTDEPLVPGPSHLEVKIAIGNLKRYKVTGSNQIQVELLCLSSTILLISFEIRMNCLIIRRRLLWYEYARTMTKLTVIIIVEYFCYHLNAKFCRISFFHG
jgi:hypothetical protein